MNRRTAAGAIGQRGRTALQRHRSRAEQAEDEAVIELLQGQPKRLGSPAMRHSHSMELQLLPDHQPSRPSSVSRLRPGGRSPSPAKGRPPPWPSEVFQPKQKRSPSPSGRTTGMEGSLDSMQMAAFETYKALPAAGQPYSQQDLALVAEILRLAEQLGQEEGSDVTLVLVLRAYDAVLRNHRLDPAEDTFYYRFLLKLSLRPHPSWWTRFNAECLRNEVYAKADAFRARGLLLRSWLHWRWTARLGPARSGAPEPPWPPQVSATPSGSSYRTSSPGERGGMKAPANGRAKDSTGGMIAVPLTGRELLSSNGRLQKKGLGSPMGVVLPRLVGEEAEAYMEFKWLAGCFHVWRKNVGLLKGLRLGRERAVLHWLRALDFWQRKQVSRLFMRWRGFQAVMLKEAVEQWRAWRQSAPFAAWKAAVEHSKAQQQRAFILRLRKFFTPWQGLAQDSQRFHTQGLEKVRAKRLRLCLLHWHAAAKLQAQHRLLVDSCLAGQHLRTLRECLRAWREWAQCSRALSQLAAEVQWKSAIRRLSSGFREWKEWSSAKQTRRVLLQSAAAILLGKRSKRALRFWRLWVVERRLRRERGARAEARVRFGVKHRTWAAWRMWVTGKARSRKLMEASVEILTKRGKRGVFKHWKLLTKCHTRAQKKGTVFAEAVKGRHLAKAYWSWRDTWWERVKVKPQRDKCNVTVMRGVVEEWKEFVGWRRFRKGRLGKAVGFWQQALMSKVVGEWVSVVKRRAVLRKVAERAAEVCQRHSLKHSLHCWRQYKDATLSMRALCSQLVRHWRSHQLARAFEAWKDRTASWHAQKNAALRALQHWRRCQLGAAFAAWREQAAYWRDKRAVANRCLDHWRLGRLQATWQVWIDYCSERRQVQYLMGEVLEKWQKVQLRACFLRWQEFIQEVQQKREYLTRVVHHWQSRLLALAFSTWAAKVAHLGRQRKLVEAVRRAWNRRVKRAFFARLQYKVGKRRTWQHAEHFYWHGLKARSVQGWGALLQAAHDRQAKADLLKEAREKRQLVGWLKGWLRIGQELRRVHEGVQKCADVQQHRWLAKAFLSWKGLWKEKKRLRGLLRMAVDRRRANELQAAFGVWLCFRQAQCAKRAAMEHHATCLKGFALQVWKDWARERRRLGRLRRVSQSSWQERCVAKAFHCWRSQLERSAWKKERLSQAVEHRERHLREVAFSRWRDFWTTLRKIKRRWQTGLCGRAFEGWRAAASLRKSLRETAEAAVKQRAMHEASAAFESMRVHAQEQRNERLAAEHWRRRTGQKALQSWQAVVRYILWKGEAVATAEARWQTAYAARALAWWHEYAREKQAQREKALIAAEHYWGVTLGRTFRRWRKVAYNAPRLRRALGHWNRLALFSAFNRWRSYVTEHQEAAAKGEAAVLFWMTCRMRAAFLGWRERFAVRREARQRLQQAVSLWTSARLRGAFQQWQQVYLVKREARAKVHIARLRQNRRIMAAALLRWRERMGALRETAALMLRMQRRHARGLVAASLRGWRETARSTRRARQLADGHWARLELRNAAAVLREWREVAGWERRSRQVVQAVLQRWQERLLAQAFEGWVDGMRERQRKRSILRRAAAMFANRQLFCFVSAWRELTAVKKLAREVLEMAQRHRCTYLMGASLYALQWHVVRERKVRAGLQRRRQWLVAMAFWAFKNAVWWGARKRQAGEAWRLRLLAEAWATWQALVLDARRKARAAAAHAGPIRIRRQSGELQDAFTRFRLACSLSKDLRELQKTWQQRMLGSILEVWLGLVNRNRAVRVLKLRRLLESLREAFQTWREKVEEVVAERATLAQVQEALVGRTQQQESARQTLLLWQRFTEASALRQWVHWVEEKSEKQAATMAALACLRKKTLRRGFQAFRHAVEWAAAKDDARGLYNETLAKKVLRWWTKYVELRSAKREKVVAALEHRARKLLHCWQARTETLKGKHKKNLEALVLAAFLLKRRALDAWLQVVLSKAAREEYCAWVMEHLQSVRKRSAFARWRTLAAKKAWHRMAVSDYQERSAAEKGVRTLVLWRRWAWRRKYLREALASFHMVRYQAMPLQAWQRCATAMLRKRRATNVAQRHWFEQCAGEALQRWKEATSHAQHFRSVLKVTTQTLQAAKLALLFRQWRALAAHRSRLRALLARSIQQWTHSRQATAFRAWVDFVSAKAGAREKLRQAALTWRRSALARAWRGFQARVAELERKRRLLGEAVRAMQRCCVRKAFASWKERIEVLRWRKEAIGQLERLREWRAKKRAFSDWRVEAFAARRLKKRVVRAWEEYQWIWREEKADAFDARSLLRRAAQAWWAEYRWQATIRSCLHQMLMMRARRALGAWRAYASQERDLKAQGRQLAARHVLLRMQRAYGLWQALSRAGAHRAASLRMRALKAWSERVAWKRYWRERQAEAEAALAEGLLRRVGWAWASLVQEILAVRAAEQQRQLFLREATIQAEKLLRKRQRGWLVEAFQGWWGRVELARGLARRAQARRLAALGEAWDSWSIHVHRRREKRQRAEAAAKVWQLKAMAIGLWQWCAEAQVGTAERREQRVRAAQFAARSRLQRMWARWRAWVYLCRERAGVLGRLLAGLLQLEERELCSAALRAWKGGAAAGKRKAARYAEVSQHRSRRLLTDCFQAWFSYLAAVKDSSFRLRSTFEGYMSDALSNSASDYEDAGAMSPSMPLSPLAPTFVGATPAIFTARSQRRGTRQQVHDSETGGLRASGSMSRWSLRRSNRHGSREERKGPREALFARLQKVDTEGLKAQTSVREERDSMRRSSAWRRSAGDMQHRSVDDVAARSHTEHALFFGSATSELLASVATTDGSAFTRSFPSHADLGVESDGDEVHVEELEAYRAEP